MSFKADLETYYAHERVLKLLDRIRSRPWQAIAFSLLVVGADYLSGPAIQFPFLYIVPVSLAAWGAARPFAYLLAVLLPATRILLSHLWGVPLVAYDLAINFAIRASMLGGLVYLLSILQNLRLLRGLLHVCSYCRRIETTVGDWMTTEEFIVRHSEAMFSHGICPGCADVQRKNFLITPSRTSDGGSR
jgi:hypothetical protein